MSRTVRAEPKLDKQRGWLAEVCAGIGRSLSVDLDVVRVATVIAALFIPKFVIAAYLLCWLVLDRREARDY
ncbi:MAG: PspC domain-containing protein [Gammaproteobacteria bacterium]|nr:PspC domain-containing protein [Gammaproteobacteria bacterium]